MKYLSILLLCFTLTSCSALGTATSVASGLLGEQPTLSVDAQMGDREAQLGDDTTLSVDDNEGIVTVTSDASKNSKQFQKADTVNIQEGPNWFFSLLMVTGWLLPSPQEVYREVKSWFTNKDK